MLRPDVLMNEEERADLIRRVPLVGFLDIRTVEISENHVVLEMPASENAMNAERRPHGGVVAALIDHVAGTVAGLLAKNRSLTADLNIRFLTAAKGEILRAEGRILRAGRRLTVVEVKITDELGTKVAQATAGMVPLIADDLPPGLDLIAPPS
jgi:uncharacterized protein (TIGR00369 family)